MAISLQSGGITRSSGTTLTVSIAPASGANPFILIIVSAFSNVGTPPSITSVVRDSKTATEITALRQSWSGDLYQNAKVWAFYLYGADVTLGAKNLVVTFSSSVVDGIVTWQQLNGAYQGAPVNYNFSRVVNDFGPLTDVIPDTQLGGYIIGVLSTVERTASGQYYALPNNFQGNLGDIGLFSSTQSTFGDASNWMNYEALGGLSDEGISEIGFGWYNQQTGNEIEADVFFVLVEIKDSSWTPSVAGVTGTSAPCPEIITTSTSISNLEHLEGQTVGILADGVPLDQQVVSNGEISLGGEYSVVQVGIPYFCDFETLNVEVPLGNGTIQGRKVKIGHVTFRVEDTRGGYIGPNEDTLYEAFPDLVTDKLQQQDPVADSDDLAQRSFTGDLRLPLGAGYEDGGRIFYRQYDPLPVSILAVIPEIEPGGSAP